MPSLLSIPRELRDRILEFVIFSYRAPPESPVEPPQERASIEYEQAECWDYGSRNVKYERKTIVPNSSPLLLVNRQLSAETKSALERFPNSYYLDVMLVDEQELHPTWLSVPSLSNRIDHVVATVRIIGFPKPGHISWLAGGCGGPAPIVWCFYYLMEIFLKFGLNPSSEPRQQERDISIQNLTLNFVSPSDTATLVPDVGKSIHYDHQQNWRQGTGISLVKRTEWVAKFIGSHIFSLLQMGYHTARHGRILHERIGTIRYCVDGELKSHYDLDKLLAKCRADEPGDTFGGMIREKRLPFFWRWKRKALEVRKRRGLPVVFPDDPEQVSDPVRCFESIIMEPT